MDYIKDTGFLEHLTGHVYLSQYQAYMDLSGSPQSYAMPLKTSLDE
jgi:hypothetical protein